MITKSDVLDLKKVISDMSREDLELYAIASSVIAQLLLKEMGGCLIPEELFPENLGGRIMDISMEVSDKVARLQVLRN